MNSRQDVLSTGVGIQCMCVRVHNPVQLVVLTGGPGAGKTAVLELIKKQLCQHTVVLPEAASIVFSGGFWRLESVTAKLAAQRAIFHVQRELENLVTQENKWALGLCDRGTLDGLAYWPEKETSFWTLLEASKEKEFEKYSAVIHLRTPSTKNGYNYQNPIRIESANEAAEIDARIARIWSTHPNYQEIESSEDFLEKAEKAVNLILQHVPDCCQTHVATDRSAKSK